VNKRTIEAPQISAEQGKRNVAGSRLQQSPVLKKASKVDALATSSEPKKQPLAQGKS